MREEAPTIRRLTVVDVADYRAIRLEALEREPGSFLSSYAREAGMSEEAWRDRLANPKGAIFGVYLGSEIVGLTGVVVDAHDAEQGVLVQGYLRADLRGRGHSRLLYEARIGWAREVGLRRLKVSHRVDNLKSREAILRNGFQRTGTKSTTWPDGTIAEEWVYTLDLSDRP